MIRRFFTVLTILLLAACSQQNTAEKAKQQDLFSELLNGATELPMAHSNTFKVYEKAHYKLIELNAPVVSWGGSAQGSALSARILLVPKDKPLPAEASELQDVTIVRTPIERIAVNYGFLEAVLIAIEAQDRLVAVGGVKSYDDVIRAKAREGELAQIGYGWHSPPAIDPLLNARPDALLMVMGDLEHTQHMQRINELGVPVVPVFFEAEMSYMGPLDYVRLVGLMTGREKQADEFVAMVEANVRELKSKVANVAPKQAMSSWYAGNDRWMVTVRNADAALLRDAGSINPLAQADDIHIDDFVKLGSEVLLEKATEIDCWIIRDPHSQPFSDIDFLQHFKAWRDGCLFAADGSVKPEADAFDLYATGVVRPDLILQDMIQMLHPDLISAPYTFIQPDTEIPRQ